MSRPGPGQAGRAYTGGTLSILRCQGVAGSRAACTPVGGSETSISRRLGAAANPGSPCHYKGPIKFLHLSYRGRHRWMRRGPLLSRAVILDSGPNLKSRAGRDLGPTSTSASMVASRALGSRPQPISDGRGVGIRGGAVSHIRRTSSGVRP